MITFFKILELYGVDPASVRLVRHGNKEIPVLETFRHELDRFEAYQSYQLPRKFGSATLIGVFAPYHNTTSLFLSLWDIEGCVPSVDSPADARQELQEHSLPLRWLDDHVRYDLRRNTVMDELSQRLVIEWGRGTVSWVQEKDKRVVELKQEGSVGDFQGYVPSSGVISRLR